MSSKFIQAEVTKEEFQLIKIAVLMAGKTVREFAKEALLEKCKRIADNAK